MTFSTFMTGTGGWMDAAASPLGGAVHVDPVSLVDPELLPVLNNMPPFDLDKDNLELIRSAQFPPPLPAPAVQPETRFISGAGSRQGLRVVVLDPAPTRLKKPAILHIHGGGLVAGMPEVAIVELQHLSAELGALIVSVDYRLAPEHPSPAALNDSYAALSWLHRSAAELGVDPRRIALMGESAGAGLAAAVSLRARDRQELPIRIQLLRYPMLDDRTSLRVPPAHVGHFVWSWRSNAFAWTAALGRKPVMNTAPPEAVPARAADFRQLPTTWIGVGSIDLFAQESIRFAERLALAGVPVELLMVPGAFHGFDTMAPQARISASFINSWKSALRRALIDG